MWAVILAFLEARRVVIKAAMLILGVFIVAAIAVIVLVVAVRTTVSVTALMSADGVDFSMLSIANTIVPLTEIMTQVYLLISVRVALILAGLAIAPLKYAYKILYNAANAGE